MAINFATAVYKHAHDTFARPVIFTPTASQPGQPAYSGRGIFGTQPIDVLTEDGAIFSDMATVLDVLEDEFTVVPVQGDILSIPAYLDMSAKGDFEVIEVKSNGGGETTLSLRRLMVTKP